MKTLDRSAALRELRDIVATYLEGSDDAPRAQELLDVLEPRPSMLSDTFWEHFKAAAKVLGDEPITEREACEREMFGFTASSIAAALVYKEPRAIARYAINALSNAQELIQRDRPLGIYDANTIRQLMNLTKYAIDKAVPR